MLAPPVYLDECVDHGLTQALRERGYVVSSVLDEEMLELGDEDQLTYATIHGWLLVTHNEKHFRLLHQTWQRRGLSHAGIVILPEKPPLGRLVIRATMMLSWIAGLDTTRSGFFRWGHLQQRLEEGHRLPEFDETDLALALGRELG
jgi:hypothetical protein